MKIIALLAALFLIPVFAGKLSAQNATNSAPLKINTLAATNYYNKEMTVTGKVAQVTIRPTVTFINLDKPYPRSPFAVVIIHQHSSFFGDVNALRGKTIEITGKIKKYNGKPEIMLDNTNQLTVVGVTNLEIFLKPANFSAPSSTNSPSMQTTNLDEIM